MDIAGHVSKQMLKHYSHIRMEAKREALESIVHQKAEAATPAEPKQDSSPAPTVVKQVEGESPQKSPPSGHSSKVSGGKRNSTPLKGIGSSGRT
jgi:hypothetical protein